MIGIILGILVMVLMAVKRWNAIVCSLVAALVVGICNGMKAWDCILNTFMPAAGSNLATFMILFLCSAIYARLVLDSGSASAIANFVFKKCGKKRVVLAVFLTTCGLTYGGVSAFVIFFLLWPLCLQLAKEADIPKSIFVPTIYAGCLGGFSLAMPGTPQTSNVIAAEMLKTTGYAAPISSILATVAMTLFSYWYLTRIQKRNEKRNLHFQIDEKQINSKEAEKSLPSFGIAVFPLVLTIIMYILLTKGVFMSKMSATPAICTSLLISCIIILICNFKRFENVKVSIGKGAMESINPLMSLCMVMAFAAVVQSTTAFANFVSTIQNMGGHPLIQMLIASNIIGLITASSSGTVRFTLDSFGSYWLSTGLNVQVLERTMTLSSCMLSFAPHSGGFFATLDVTGESHKTVYIDSFIACVGGVVIGFLVVVGCYFIGIV